MGHRYYLLVVLLSGITLLSSCTKPSGMYSNILNDRSKCKKNCLKETNDVWRVHCYTRALDKDPDNPELYLKRGLTYFETFKYTAAVNDFKKVIELEPGNIKVYYFLARSSSLAIRKEDALYWLEKALESGFDDYPQLAADPSFENIRKTQGYQRLMEQWQNELSVASEKALP